MPSLPRIKRPRSRTRAEEPVAAARREPAELSANGLLWIHLDSPEQDVSTVLAERFGWHALDVEDVHSKRQRPKIDEYPEYIFGVLHFPFYDKAVQRLNAAELDFFLGQGYLVTLPTVELLPVSRLFQRCVEHGYVYKGTYTGQYCFNCELYVNEAKAGDPCPDCGRPTETVTEENYFFKLPD